jgi:quercetin dioxygenase-like cupin family protein
MGKYDKYFMTEANLPESKQETAAKNAGIYTHVAWLDTNKIPGAFYTECVWYYKPRKSFVGAHTHDFDEVIAFFGSNPDDIHDLGGEVELWMGGEKHIITRSCLVFVPKGTEHCPLSFNRVDRPIFHFTAGTGGKYISSIERVD